MSYIIWQASQWLTFLKTMCMQVWGTDNFWDSVLSFYHAGSRIVFRLLGLASKYLYPLSISPIPKSLMCKLWRTGSSLQVLPDLVCSLHTLNTGQLGFGGNRVNTFNYVHSCHNITLIHLACAYKWCYLFVARAALNSRSSCLIDRYPGVLGYS